MSQNKKLRQLQYLTLYRGVDSRLANVIFTEFSELKSKKTHLHNEEDALRDSLFNFYFVILEHPIKA